MMRPMANVEPMRVMSTGSRVGSGIGLLAGGGVWGSVGGMISCMGIKIYDTKNCEQSEDGLASGTRRREELGLKQRDIAIGVNVSMQTGSNWETGRYKEAKLTLPQVKALCQVLQWSIEELPDELGPAG